jgi:hypothetical protein
VAHDPEGSHYRNSGCEAPIKSGVLHDFVLEIASADFVSLAMTVKGDAHNGRRLTSGRSGEILT